MAIYLGNKKVSTKSGYVATGMKDFFNAGGKCKELTATNIDNFIKFEDTSSVTDMSDMFYACKNLTTIPLIDTSNVTDMTSMFYVCENLTTIPELNTGNVTKMDSVFYYCSKLTAIPALNTSNATTMISIFRECSELITIPELNTSNVRNMRNMFAGCTRITTIPKLDASNATDMGSIFYRCRNLTEIHMTGMKVSFDISSSTKFTHEALVEILNNLATVTSTQTLTMGRTNLAKLTEEDKVIATNKGWTLA